MERDSITLADLLGLGEPDLPPSKKCKKKKKVDRFYSEEHVQMALFEVENGISSLRRAAIKFNVPRSTLVFRRSPKFTKVEKGPRPILSREEEDELASWILQGEKYGAPRKYVHIQNWVQKLLNDHPRDNVPFQDNKPGRGWMKNFMKRHPELNAMRSISFEDHCETARASVKKEALLDVSTKPADIISRTTPGNLDEDGVASLRRAIYRTRVAVQKKTSQEPLLDSGTPLTADDVIDEVDCGLLEPKLEIPDPEYEKNENHTAIAGATCETSASDDISSKYQSRARGQQPSVSSLPSTGSLNAEDPNNLPESAEEELGFDNEEVYEPESKRVKVEAIEYMGFESEAPCSSTSRGESRLSNESFELKPILDGTHNFGDNEAFESQTDKSSLVIPKPCTNQPGPSPKTGVRTAPARERNDLFGEYVAAKLRSLKTDAARNRVECLIANILYEASKGTFDDAVTTADITNIIQAYLTSTKDLQFSDSAVTKPSTSML